MRLAPAWRGLTCTLLALSCLLLPLPSAFAANGKGMISVGKTANPPVINGKLDDACWQSAIEIAPFLLAKEYAMAKEQTKAYICYDSTNLYVAFYCKESCLDPVANRLHEFRTDTREKDGKNIWNDDCVGVLLMLDSAGKKEFFDIIVNGAGVISDAVCKAPDFWKSRDVSWDSDVKAAVERGNGYWSVEMSIPFSRLGGSPREGASWGMLAGRIESSNKETSSWLHMSTGFHNPDDFGTMTFAGSVPGIKLAAMPDFFPGKNILKLKTKFDGAPTTLRISTSVMFENDKPANLSKDAKVSGSADVESEFTLDKNGRFDFSWSYENPFTMQPYFTSPLYKLEVICASVEARNMKGDFQLYINGSPAKSSFSLIKGENLIAIESKGELSGEFTVGDFKFPVDGTWKFSKTPAAGWNRRGFDDSKWEFAKLENGKIPGKGFLRKTLLFEHSLIWPNWKDLGVSIPSGSLQQIIFQPNGIKGKPRKDYRFAVEVPEAFEVAGFSGYYETYKIRAEKPEIVSRNGKNYKKYFATFENGIACNETLPLYKQCIFVVQAPQASSTADSTIYFYSSFGGGDVVEIPQRLKVSLLPPLNGKQPKNHIIQMWPGWLRNLTDAELATKLRTELIRMGVNETDLAKQDNLRKFSLISFEPYAISCSPFLGKHPEMTRIDFKGNRCPNNICTTAILEDSSVQLFLEDAVKSFMEKRNFPNDVNWDYESNVFDSYIACFCPRCIRRFKSSFNISKELTPPEIKSVFGKEWIVFMNRNMAAMAAIFRADVKKVSPKSIFSVYSGYQSEHTKSFYGVDWSMLADKVDLAICGYGRPEKELKDTLLALGKTPLIAGDCVTPYLVTERKYPTYCGEATLLRRACDGTKGFMVYEYAPLDGKTFYAISEVSRLLSDYEEFFTTRQKAPDLIECRGLGKYEVEVFTKGGNERLLLLMNETNGNKAYEIKNLKLWDRVTGFDYFENKKLENPEILKGTLPPKGIKAIILK
jgi:hypothetical protein